VCDARQSALSTPQAPQDERDLGAIDEIFDVPHARLASTPKPGSPGANASGVPRLLRLRYRALTPAAGTPPGRRTTLTGCWLAMRRRGHRHHFGAAGRGALERLFHRAPFAIIALSGLTPLPFFPFKALAFAARYPRDRYVAAVAAGRLPRYLLLAWLGIAVRLPTWLLAAVFVALVIPSLRVILWPPRRAS